MSKGSVTHKAGLPPGTLLHIGKKRMDAVQVSVIDYSLDEFNEKPCDNVNDCFPFKDNNRVSWIDVDGLHDVTKIEQIGSYFELHPLLLEDILNTGQRPKVEEFDKHIFVTLKMLGISKDKRSIVTEQISFVLGDTWVLSFQEQAGDLFDGLRSRLQEGKGNIRQKGADYLLYRLIDTIVDNYFFVTDHIAERSEKLEEEALNGATQETLHKIQKTKKQLIQLRRLVAPMREGIGALQKDESGLIRKETTRYLRDVYEHVVHVLDSIETQKDIISGITDLYLSGVSNKMNQVMQVLTIIATIFIPLTFVAGIYGMNFKNMPELEWEYGYIAAWVLMAIIVIGLIIFFKRKKWL